jgi:Fe-S-cluster containining protein
MTSSDFLAHTGEEVKRFGMIFTKMQFPDFDVYLPFECQMCGECCSRYEPRFSYGDLLGISICHGISEQEVFRSYQQAFSLQLKGKTVSCIFLRNRLCSIYDHELRPQACTLFPFSFQYANIQNCPGYDFHVKLLDKMLEEEAGYCLYDSSFCPKAPFRAPTELHKQKFWGRFIGLKPSPMLIRKYVVINELQESPIKRPQAVEAR